MDSESVGLGVENCGCDFIVMDVAFNTIVVVGAGGNSAVGREGHCGRWRGVNGIFGCSSGGSLV